MGIVKRQGLFFTLISYLGIIVGAINVLFLVPRLMGMSNYGILNLLIAISIIYSQISQIGIPSILIKFFPAFRTENKLHAGFITWISILGLISFIVCTCIFLGFRYQILNYYADKSSGFAPYFYQVIPLAFFTILYAALDTITRSLYKSIFSAFLNDIALKLLTSVGILLFYFGKISFSQFIYLYIYSSGLVCLLIIAQLWLMNEFKFTLKLDISREKSIELIRYGFYNLLAGSTLILVQKTDVIMLAHFTNEAIVGVYVTFIYISSVILIPSKSINRLAYTLIADHFVKNDLKSIGEIYSRTSIIQMLLGCFIFTGILLNKECLLLILHKPLFRTEFRSFYWLGLAILIDITGGLNTYIIAISHKFRISTLILICSFVLCLLMNWVLIPYYGSMGAAMALFISNTFLNFTNWFYIRMRFKLQPFTLKHLIMVAITVFTITVFSFFPYLGNVFLDIIIRSTLITLVFGLLVIVFKISPDINQQLLKLKNSCYQYFGS